MTARPVEAAIAEGIFPFVVLGFLWFVGYIGYLYGSHLQSVLTRGEQWPMMEVVLPHLDVGMAALFVLGFGLWIMRVLTGAPGGESA